jgi:pimeloyl-ACP methyl ester carboxylesterase
MARRRLTGLVVSLLALLELAACSPRRTLEAARLLLDLPHGQGSADGNGALAGVQRTVLMGNAPPGDLYYPAQDRVIPEAAIVLVPGLVPEGKDDPRLVAFAGTLARARFAVFVPELPGFRAQRASPADAAVVARAVAGLAGCFGPESRPALGLAAISYAVGPALLAMLDHDNARRVRLALAIGGYHSVEAAVRFFTTGRYREEADGPWLYRPPNDYGKWVFVLANAERLQDSEDRRLLAGIARRKLRDPDADVAPAASQLGTEGRHVLALIDNPDPDLVAALMAALPLPLRNDLEALDLAARDLSGLDARFILIHGRDDPIIPASESRALAAALPSGRTGLYVIDSLGHVELGPKGLHDAARLWRAAYDLLAGRDGLPRPDFRRCVSAQPPGSTLR